MTLKEKRQLLMRNKPTSAAAGTRRPIQFLLNSLQSPESQQRVSLAHAPHVESENMILSSRLLQYENQNKFKTGAILAQSAACSDKRDQRRKQASSTVGTTDHASKPRPFSNK
jgi:hypothetical protein